jgi:hypothetical protein
MGGAVPDFDGLRFCRTGDACFAAVGTTGAGVSILEATSTTDTAALGAATA